MDERVSISPPTAADLAFMDAHVRDIDRLEFDVMNNGRDFLTSLHELARVSTKILVGRWHKRPVVIYGIVPRSLLGGEGSPWLVATDQIFEPDVARAFARHCRPALAELSEGFDYLWNLVHTDNAAAIRWLGWLGFRFTGFDVTVSGHTFTHFKMEVDDVLSRNGNTARVGIRG